MCAKYCKYIYRLSTVFLCSVKRDLPAKWPSFVQLYAEPPTNDQMTRRSPSEDTLWIQTSAHFFGSLLQKRFVHKMPLPRSAETQLIRRSAHTFLQAWTLQRNFNGQRLDILLEMQKMQHCASVNCQLNTTRSSSRS